LGICERGATTRGGMPRPGIMRVIASSGLGRWIVLQPGGDGREPTLQSTSRGPAAVSGTSARRRHSN
jgi:hypothetical protein